MLVEAGADLNCSTQEGENALILAAKGKHVDCVKYLTEYMPSSALNHKDDVCGKTALMWAASSPEKESPLCMQHLTAAGAKVEEGDKDGYTALMLAVQNRHTDAVSLLLNNGALISIMTSDGETPLSTAL